MSAVIGVLQNSQEELYYSVLLRSVPVGQPIIEGQPSTFRIVSHHLQGFSTFDEAANCAKTSYHREVSSYIGSVRVDTDTLFVWSGVGFPTHLEFRENEEGHLDLVV